MSSLGVGSILLMGKISFLTCFEMVVSFCHLHHNKCKLLSCGTDANSTYKGWAL